MRTQGGGKIVAIGTDAGRVATVGESFIGGATGGMMQMCRVLARELGRDGIRLVGADAAQDLLLRTVRAALPAPDMVPPHRARQPLHNLLAPVGKAVDGAAGATAESLGFLGLVMARLAATLVHPRRLRLTALVHHMETAGLNAVPIVCMITFLIGAVMAYQGAEQLRRFGAEVFAVNLVAAGFLREIGILLTAIMVAGRSGSAFTAQIGSMKLREEIDAMRTMGLDPVEVLVLPRVIALVIMVPVLGFIAAMMGLLGAGLVLWLELGMSPGMCIERLYVAADFWDGAVAFVKAPFFGLMIALIGCFEGLKVEGSAESVGQRTTASVVEGIFTVIVVDAIFSILFLKLGI
jgi:phospholipid/cholesterol/gamma-HCH transport system permease protein